MIASVLGNLTISVVLARLLGSGGLGVYTLYGVLGVVLIPLVSLSLPSAVTKYVSEFRGTDQERLSKIASTAFIILLLAGALGAVLVFFIIAPAVSQVYAEDALRAMLSILALALLANMIGLFAGALLQGLEEFQTASLVGAIGVVANIPLLLVLVPPLGLTGAAASGAVAAAVYACSSGVASVRAIGRQGIRWSWIFDRESVRMLFAYAAPLNAASLLARLSALIQNSLVAIYIGFVDLGLLRVAGVFHNGVLLLPRAFLAPMLPVLSSVIASRSAERTRELLTQVVKMGCLLVIPLAAAITLALPVGTSLLFGPE